MTHIEKVAYRGWPACYRVSNGEVEAVVTSDIGPRIMRYAFAGGRNFLKEFEEQMGKSGEPEWQLRGGHRIWIAPEDRLKTYAPDNGPAEVRIEGGVLTATQPVEPLTGLEKQISVAMEPAGTGVEIVHRIRNAGREPFRLAPWALSMMAPGGIGIHGFPPRGTHPEMLAAAAPLVTWHFTDLSDARLSLLRKYLVLRQDPANATPQKVGCWNAQTWAAYLLDGDLFVKRMEAHGDPSGYPDMGASFEIFTNAVMLELETLGPVRVLQPGDTAVHTERWNLYRGVRVERWDDEELDRAIGPLIK